MYAWRILFHINRNPLKDMYFRYHAGKHHISPICQGSAWTGSGRHPPGRGCLAHIDMDSGLKYCYQI